MILVELAGAPGVGKSTLAPLLARRLRELLGENRVAALPEKDLPRRRRRWRKIHRWLWMAANPQWVLGARRMAQMRPPAGSFHKWLHAYGTIGIGRRALRNDVQVVLIDQGLLRLGMVAEHAAAVPAPLLPDLVLQLTADPAELELRRIYRSKPQHNRFQGATRLAQGRATRQLLQNLPEDRLRETLLDYGRKFCEPPLSEVEVADLIREPVAAESAAARKPGAGRCAPAACEVLKQRGVRWQTIDNSKAGALDAVVSACAEAILAADAAAAVRPAPGAASGPAAG